MANDQKFDRKSLIVMLLQSNDLEAIGRRPDRPIPDQQQKMSRTVFSLTLPLATYGRQ